MEISRCSFGAHAQEKLQRGSWQIIYVQTVEVYRQIQKQYVDYSQLERTSHKENEDNLLLICFLSLLFPHKVLSTSLDPAVCGTCVIWTSLLGASPLLSGWSMAHLTGVAESRAFAAVCKSGCSFFTTQPSLSHFLSGFNFFLIPFPNPLGVCNLQLADRFRFVYVNNSCLMHEASEQVQCHIFAKR